jgi:hypothetical protein
MGRGSLSAHPFITSYWLVDLDRCQENERGVVPTVKNRHRETAQDGHAHTQKSQACAPLGELPRTDRGPAYVVVIWKSKISLRDTTDSWHAGLESPHNYSLVRGLHKQNTKGNEVPNEIGVAVAALVLAATGQTSVVPHVDSNGVVSWTARIDAATVRTFNAADSSDGGPGALQTLNQWLDTYLGRVAWCKYGWRYRTEDNNYIEELRDGELVVLGVCRQSTHL